MKIKIYYVEVAPELESKEFDLASVIKSKGECIVGRSPECDLPLEGADLSRQHGKFWIKNDHYYFVDLGSSNGSLFNGELADPNHEYLLNIGDTVRLGDFVLKMEPAEEIAATVMKVLDPALFKPRPPVIVDASQPEPQISPVVPVVGLASAAISMPMIVDRSQEELPDLAQPLPSVLIEDEWSNDRTPDLVATEPPLAGLVEDKWSNNNTSDYLQDSTFEQVIAAQPSVELAIEDEEEIELPTPVMPQNSTVEQVTATQPWVGLAIEDEEEIELPNPVMPQNSTFEQVIAPQPSVGLAIEDEAEIELPDPVIPVRSLSVLMLDDEDDEVAELPDPIVATQPPSLLTLEEKEEELAEVAIATQPPSTLVFDEDRELPDPVVAAQSPSTAVLDELSPVIATQPPSTLVFDEEEEEEDERSEPVMATQPPSAIVLDELSDPVIATQPPSTLVFDEEEEEEEELAESVVAAQPPSTLAIEDEVTGDLPETVPASVIEDPEAPEPIASIVAEQPAETLVDEDDEAIATIPDPAIELHPTASVIEDPEEPEPITAIVAEQPAETLVDEDDEDDEAIAGIPDSAIELYPDTTLAIEDEDPQELTDLFATAQPPAGLAEVEAEDDDDDDLPNLLVTEQLSDDLVVGEIDTAESLLLDENPEVEPISAVPVVAAIGAVAVGINSPPKKFGAKLLSQKQIVLIAHDEKVADLTDLVNQHKDFLATCLTISWGSIAGTLRQETGISVSKELPSGVSGGFQTLAGLVNSGDVLAVIFLKDFLAPAQAGQANEEALLRLCNINEILLATNVATAESIVHYLQS
jgi:methylglyoxal synthase